MANSTQPDQPTEVLDPQPVNDATVSHDLDVEAIIAPLENLPLPSEDGIPLESNWHRICMNLLIDCVIVHMGARTDYFVGGNMFIYFSFEQARNRDFRGPDFFFVDGASFTPPRDYWALWDEGGLSPDAIIELSSPTTAEVDRTVKFRTYERVFRTPDYFIYDPASETLDGWHLVNRSYERLTPNEHGRLWCSALGLWVGVWRGMHQNYDTTWLRFFDSAGNVVPTTSERERRRADAAEAEVARLRELLARQEKDAGPSGG
jgi:Uma2 family endonuclease